MEWISINDRTPENDDDVLVYNYKDGINIGSFSSENVSKYNSGWDTDYQWAPYMNPTHWMPLPKAPEE